MVFWLSSHIIIIIIVVVVVVVVIILLLLWETVLKYPEMILQHFEVCGPEQWGSCTM